MSETQKSTASEEQFASSGPDQEICFQTFGSPDGEPLLLVMGLSGPMIWWPTELCEQLVEKGFYVIRFDNRDVGRSFRAKRRVSRADLVKAFAGRRVDAPYSISDMAWDGLAVLDHLGIQKAHVCGMSMGGMIVQTLGIEHPERVLSVTSVMSSTGSRKVGWQHPSLIPKLLRSPGRGREAYADATAAFWQVIGSPGYPTEHSEVRARALETYDRGISGSGVMRQMLAVLTQPNRTNALTTMEAPLLVIHGRADKMVHSSGGRATSKAVPGSELVLIDGMGHDLPRGLWQVIVDGVRRNADRVSA